MNSVLGVVGQGRGADAVVAALSDIEGSVEELDDDAIDEADFAVVIDEVGAPVFRRANRAGIPWIAVELGGVGGHAITEVDAAVSGFSPETACFDCLSARVVSNREEDGENVEYDGVTERYAGAVAGREAARLASGEESSLLGGVREIPHAERRLFPVPGCPTCGEPRDRTLGIAYEERTLDDAVGRAELAMDERIGIVRSLGEVSSFPVPYYLASTADTSGFSDARAAAQSAGVSADWDEALMKALGEGMERYCAGIYREEEFAVARPSELGNAVSPAEFVRPTGWEDPSDEEIEWVSGRNLTTGDLVHLPAEFVHFPPPSMRFKPSITTGLGLGNSTVEALLSGIYEVIERDATMLAWYSTFEPLGLAVEDGGFEALVKRARAEELEVTALLVTQDIDVPVVAVAVHREGEWPKFAVGSGANLDPDAAARSALAEALQNWTELKLMGKEDAANEDGSIGRYAAFPDAAREFVAPETTIPSSSVGSAVPEGVEELETVVSLARDAFQVYGARLTTRDVASLGFEGARVLVPDAQPLFTGDAFFGERARTVPGELGFEPRPDREPHPYP
ncbi:bacteriocin biosynthesis protein SagD [Haladaptatus sp. R4]|uniref:YcaO-like family protein n=1 Tax=Haladaptatus sp. R4 TaxID=1679489 RepID=UPI0007B4D7E7|nr:YcaO-like family protein [Haladaptatus sp. R4]KZN25813.1 bacteriocin biosynthesis protein SagD [Haladaptatus sp. R4]